MKRCLTCEHFFVSPGWRCPACGNSPRRSGDFILFAPHLATSNDGMEPGDHHILDQLHDQSFWFRARNRFVTDLVKAHFARAERVLEVGCGGGYVLRALKGALPSSGIVGTEIYADGLVYARRQVGSDVELLQADARAIPFSAEFDLICAFDVLEHIEDDEAALAEMHQALRPGGGVLFSVPQHPLLWSRVDEVSHHKRRYRRGELEKKCRRVGFEVVGTTSYVTILLPIFAVQRLFVSRRKNYDPVSELVLPAWLDRALEMVLELERVGIRAGLSYPVGASRFIVARRLENARSVR